MLRASVKIVEILMLIDGTSAEVAERGPADQIICTFSIDMV